jgi:SAM-dependent methyltransferase
MARIKSAPGTAAPSIDRASVVAFFEQRAKKAETLGPVRAVIYQDRHPNLAEKRDAAEKALLLPKLGLSAIDRVLDLGCGTGRWAEAIVPVAGHYHGVDVSPGLVAIAQGHFASYSNARFTVSGVDELSADRLGDALPFSRILCCGVLIYLNDDEVRKTLAALADLAATHCRLVVREPVGLENRLSIVDHFSEDMDQIYNAIYRTEGELLEMMAATLGTAGFNVAGCGDVYAEAGLNNRADTKQRWFVLER